MTECSYELGKCKRKVEFWLLKTAKFSDPFPNWWYPLCKFHSDMILKDNIFKVSELIFDAQMERERKRKYKERKYVNWKMFLNWEKLEYHAKIHVWDKAYGDIKITMALKEHRKNNLIKYKKRLKKMLEKFEGDKNN